MLSPQLRSQFITKILTSAAGDQYRVVFLVGLVSGKVNAQVVSSTLISKAEKEVACLPIFIEKKTVEYIYKPNFKEIISSFSEFFFLTSQPIRAPAL